MRRTPGALAALAAVVATVGVAAPASAGPAASDDLPVVGRVLVLALPGTTWEELDEADAPNLDELLAASAVANLSVRVERLRTEPGAGYATIGAGTRALGNRLHSGLAFDAGERYETGDAADVYARLTGAQVGDAAVVHVRQSLITRENERSLFDARIGSLGAALRTAGITAGVVANADQTNSPLLDVDYRREAVLAVADPEGLVPCGAVGPELLERDDASPYGVRLAHAVVVDTALECLGGAGVVLVEASDLRRADGYGLLLEGARREEVRRSALERTDVLVGEILASLDLSRDAVVVVAPSAPQADVPRLTVFAVRAPGLAPGLLESGVTRQPGFVSIVDVAPTIGALAGAPLDEEEIEGRAVVVGRTGASWSDRLEHLVDAEAAARFRDRVLTSFTATFIALEALLAVAFAWSVWRGRGPWRLLELAALSLLFVLPLTYWSALIPFADVGMVPYLAFTIGGGLVLGVLATSLRANPLAPLAAVLATMLATTTVSVVALGSRLQLSTVFGDSPIVGGRFSGVNNVTFSQVTVAAILLAVFVRHRWPERGGLVGAGAVLASALIVVGAPMWGADVGGVLAGVPAFAVTFTLLAGWRVSVRAVVVFAAATVVLLGALGALDLTRPSESRSHLGRFLERIGEDGWDAFSTVIGRKLAQNFRTVMSSVWRFITLPLMVFAGFLAWRAPGRARDVRERVPELHAGLAGLGVAAVVGYAVNDSGIAVPGVMVAVLIPAAATLVARVASEVDAEIDVEPRIPALDPPVPAVGDD